MIHGDRRAVLKRARGGRLMIGPLSMDIWELIRSLRWQRRAGGERCSPCDRCIALQSVLHRHSLNLVQYFGFKQFGI